ncbi:UNVERIFIED_CONTAM: Mediator of RNA polymerase II transcription subunit [Sesamum calycinum]|uniref:Mediator of RNA polymerase II transcription subunit 13 n=1 Tax=Sesamum calycinum TaxID=2727403 RepID=A0AAW2PLX4_9LAMI
MIVPYMNSSTLQTFVGGLHQISWFQFLPHEFDFNTLPDKSVKVDQKDAATLAVLSAHVQLQKEGFLSTWTNSFVGPWDPSQGLHNPGTSQASTTSSQSGYLEGYTPVKSLGSTSASYVLIPSPSMRFLPPAILQLPTCLTADSPPLAHLLHSKGSAIPLSTGFVVSKAVPSMRKDYRSLSKEEWPSILSVSLVDYYGGNNFSQEKIVKGVNKQVGRSMNSDAKDFEVETHMILESIAAELHSLSWMTVSPAYLERRSALPFHCDMVLRLRRLLHFADKELSRLPEKARV